MGVANTPSPLDQQKSYFAKVRLSRWHIKIRQASTSNCWNRSSKCKTKASHFLSACPWSTLVSLQAAKTRNHIFRKQNFIRNKLKSSIIQIDSEEQTMFDFESCDYTNIKKHGRQKHKTLRTNLMVYENQQHYLIL